MKILLYGRAGSGKTNFIKNIVARIKPETVSLLAYTDYHENDVYDFARKYKDRENFIATLNTPNKNILFDLFFENDSPNTKPQLFIFDECGALSDERFKDILKQCDFCNRSVIVTSQRRRRDMEKYFDVCLHLDPLTHKVDDIYLPLK